MTPLERHCRWLLCAYPAWYRRRRAGEMIGTLLEAAPPGASWPSGRDARALIAGGLRVRGWAWGLALAWVTLGTGGAVYAFVTTTRTCNGACAEGLSPFPRWNGEPGVIVAVGVVAAVAWLLLAFVVLTAGLTRFSRRPSRNGTRWCAWAGSWLAGMALMVATYTSAFGWFAGNGPLDPAARTWPASGPAVGWGELAVCAAWLALGAAMTWILAAPGPGNAAGNRTAGAR